MSEKKEEGHAEGPPALPGEVWRGMVMQEGAQTLCCVAPDRDADGALAAWRYLEHAPDDAWFGRWRERVNQKRGDVFMAWAMAERGRAEKYHEALRVLAARNPGTLLAQEILALGVDP